MKIFLSLFLIISLSTLLCHCKSDQKPEIQSGIDECKHCKMVISQINQACGFIQDNNFVTFCSPKCLLSEYEYLKKEKKINTNHIFFTDYESRNFVRSDSTFFLHTTSIPTVMNSGVICFRSLKNAESLKSQQLDIVTNWRKYRIMAGTPDKTVRLKLSKNSLEPAVLVFNKNEIIHLAIEMVDQQGHPNISIKGYEDIGNFTFPEGESILTIKLLTDKPGSGFPIIMKGIEQPIGMLKISGAHTRDEEVM